MLLAEGQVVDILNIGSVSKLDLHHSKAISFGS